MAALSFRRLPKLLRTRGFALGLWAAGCSALVGGCDTLQPVVRQNAPRPSSPVVAALPTAPVVVQSAYHPENLPAPEAAPAPQPLPKAVVAATPAPKELPITLDTVLRLAEEQNTQIAVAREKVNESQAEHALAERGWLPKVYAGVGYFRHEGGIQNPDGTFVHSSFGNLYPGIEIDSEIDLREATYNRVNAERKVWQQKGELRKVTTETLLEAADTYFDLLTVRRAEAVLRALDRHEVPDPDHPGQTKTASYQDTLLKRAKDLQKDVGDVLIEGVRAEMVGRQQALAKLHQQGDAASAKLVYLLGLDPLTQLVPMDEAPVPIDAVDPTPEPAVLVERALTAGPGVRELQMLLAVLQDGMGKLEGPQRFIPKIGLTANEGAWGAGPGSNLTWDNRFDVGVSARWNLTEFLTAREQRRAADSRMQQAQLSYKDLRGKLALSVEEARTAILSGKEQIKLGEEQIQHASRTLELTNTRLVETVPGSSTTEVLQSLRGLELAHSNYLQAIAAHNKAEIRLMLLLGPAACK